MKFYDEIQTGEIRKALEKEILKWPGVTSKEMMGCLCYFYDKKFFAFLVTKGLVLTKLSEEDKAKLSKQTKLKPFEMSGKKVSTWVTVALGSPGDLQPVLPFVKKSYEAASSKISV